MAPARALLDTSIRKLSSIGGTAAKRIQLFDVDGNGAGSGDGSGNCNGDGNCHDRGSNDIDANGSGAYGMAADCSGTNGCGRWHWYQWY